MGPLLSDRAKRRITATAALAGLLLYSDYILRGLPIIIECGSLPAAVVAILGGCPVPWPVHITGFPFVQKGLMPFLPLIGFLTATVLVVSGPGFRSRKALATVCWLLLLIPLLRNPLYSVGWYSARHPGPITAILSQANSFLLNLLSKVDYFGLLKDWNLEWLWFALCLLFIHWGIKGEIGSLGFRPGEWKDRLRWMSVILGAEFLVTALAVAIWLYALRQPKPPAPDIHFLVSAIGIAVLTLSTFSEQVIQVYFYVNLRRCFVQPFIAILIPALLRAILHSDYYLGIPMVPTLAVSVLGSSCVQLWVFSRTSDIVPLWAAHFTWDSALVAINAVLHM